MCVCVCVCVWVSARVWCWQRPASGRQGVHHTTMPLSAAGGQGYEHVYLESFRWGSLRLCEEQGVEDKDVWHWMFGCVLVMRSWDTSDSAQCLSFPLGEFVTGRIQKFTALRPWIFHDCSVFGFYQCGSVRAGILMTAVVLISKQQRCLMFFSLPQILKIL